MNIGKNIQHWRERRNMSQEALAAKAEISQSYLSEVEADLKEPSLHILDKITTALEIYITDLFPCDCKKCVSKKCKRKRKK